MKIVLWRLAAATIVRLDSEWMSGCWKMMQKGTLARVSVRAAAPVSIFGHALLETKRGTMESVHQTLQGLCISTLSLFYFVLL